MGAAAVATSQGGQIGAHTGVITWLQFGGNSYVVEAINTGSVAAAHPALTATDEVVTIVGSVRGKSVGAHGWTKCPLGPRPVFVPLGKRPPNRQF